MQLIDPGYFHLQLFIDLRLDIVDLAVNAGLLQQVCMLATLHDAPMIQHQHAVEIAQRGKPVRQPGTPDTR